MKILHVHMWTLAGMPYRLEVAQRARGNEVLRLQLRPTRTDAAMGFPSGDSWCERVRLFVPDVVHYHQLAALHAKSLYGHRWSCPSVLTIHGDPDRHPHSGIEVDATTIVTPELSEWYQGAIFVPNFVLDPAIADSDVYKQKEAMTLTLLKPCGHAGKNREGFSRLAAELGPLVRVVSDDSEPGTVQNDAQLANMRRADVVWDHLHGFYGITTLEAWASGALSVVSPTNAVRDAVTSFFGEPVAPPFFCPGPTLSEIVWWVKELAGRPDVLRESQEYARRFMEYVWTSDRILDAYDSIYRSAGAVG